MPHTILLGVYVDQCIVAMSITATKESSAGPWCRCGPRLTAYVEALTDACNVCTSADRPHRRRHFVDAVHLRAVARVDHKHFAAFIVT